MTGRQLGQLARIPVTELKRVTARKAAGLEQMGISTVLDLITCYPRRHVDRTNEAAIADLAEGETGVVTAAVVSGGSRRLRNGRAMAEIVVRDHSGTLTCTFFNQAWRARQFAPGEVVTVFGRLTYYRGRRQMANPGIDPVGDETRRFVPVYPQSERARVSSAELARYIDEALERAKEFAEPLGDELRGRLGLVSRTEALRWIHAPETPHDYDRARRRLVFDELLRLQVLLVWRRRRAIEASNGIAHEVNGALLSQFLSRLPFDLTGSQARAMAEIRHDLSLSHPMNRLLQGDVGAGKTVVALATLLVGVEGGYQGAFMVPTEVLAEQHYLSARELLAGLSVSSAGHLGEERPLLVDLLTNKTSGAERTRILTELAAGELDVVIGTHALISEGVDFARLGVVVVDEQHRFGVEQRASLREKASLDPDLLVMTATPIPRTAAMTVYGDLDHTTLDELPAGRSPITTRWLAGEGREATAWKRVGDEVAAGHQAFVVCPLVGLGGGEDEAPGDPDEAPDDPDEALALDEDGEIEPALLERAAFSERRPPRDAVSMRDVLATGPLEGLRIGLLHGQMPAKEKEPVMSSFRSGEIDVLVATTVVEVGVDVSNATVMVIVDADRFGMAQLHQLRGRVGRGTLRSWCFLLTADDVTDTSRRRLEALVRTQNGFELAEEDLSLRGGGTVLGARQKGKTDLKLADLTRDRDLVLEARRVAGEILDADRELDGIYLPMRYEVERLMTEEERAFLFRS